VENDKKTPPQLSAERRTAQRLRKKRQALAFWKADIPQNGESIPFAWKTQGRPSPNDVGDLS
jgi:hypothetical protein